MKKALSDLPIFSSPHYMRLPFPVQLQWMDVYYSVRFHLEDHEYEFWREVFTLLYQWPIASKTREGMA